MVIRKEEVYAVYVSENDLTIIFRDVYGKDGDPVSCEIVGFHFGAPCVESEKFIGKLKAEF